MASLRKLILALALLTVAAATQATEQPWVARSNDNAKLLLSVLAKYSPETASQLGVDGYDEAITDFTRDLYEPQNADFNAAVVEYRQRLAKESDPKVKQDLEILISAAQDNVTSNALARKYFIPYTDVTGLVFGVVQQTLDPRIPAARQQQVAVRLAKYSGTAKGFTPVAELAKERTLERIKAEPS